MGFGIKGAETKRSIIKENKTMGFYVLIVLDNIIDFPGYGRMGETLVEEGRASNATGLFDDRFIFFTFTGSRNF